MFTDCHALFHLRHYWYAGESLCFLLCPLNGTLTKCVLSTKKKLIFFRKIIEHFDSRFLEIWLLSQTPIIIAIIISKLLWRDYWYFFGESLRCNYRRALQIFRTLKPLKKILASMYKFLCSSKCIYQVQMTMMRGSITDKFWMFTFECNVLLIQFFTVLLILNVITLPRYLINFVP